MNPYMKSLLALVPLLEADYKDIFPSHCCLYKNLLQVGKGEADERKISLYLGTIRADLKGLLPTDSTYDKAGRLLIFSRTALVANCYNDLIYGLECIQPFLLQRK